MKNSEGKRKGEGKETVRQTKAESEYAVASLTRCIQWNCRFCFLVRLQETQTMDGSEVNAGPGLDSSDTDEPFFPRVYIDDAADIPLPSRLIRMDH